MLTPTNVNKRGLLRMYIYDQPERNLQLRVTSTHANSSRVGTLEFYRLGHVFHIKYGRCFLTYICIRETGRGPAPAMLPVVLADGKELDSPGAPVEAVAHRRAPQNRAELKEIACLGSPREVASARGRGVRCSGLIRRFLSLNL